MAGNRELSWRCAHDTQTGDCAGLGSSPACNRGNWHLCITEGNLLTDGSHLRGFGPCYLPLSQMAGVESRAEMATAQR